MAGANITSIVGWFVDPIKEQMKVMAEANITSIVGIVGWFVDPIKEQMKVMAEATNITSIVGWFVALIKEQMKVMTAATIIFIVGWFVNPIKEQMKCLFNLRGNMTNLKKAVSDLKVTKEEIEEKIKRATEARDDEVPTKNVEKWLNKVITTLLSEGGPEDMHCQWRGV